MSKKKNEKSFEESFERLSEIVEKLEADETTLDDSLTLYEEALELSQFCVERLTQSQARLKELKKRADGIFEIVDSEIS